MKKIVYNGIVAIMLLSLTVVSSGCVALAVGAAAGAGGVAYYKGSLSKNLDSSVTEVHKAALKTLKDKEIFVMADELNRHDAKIKAEFDSGDNITITVDALTELSSKINIRVGVIGDRDRSDMLLEAIESRL